MNKLLPLLAYFVFNNFLAGAQSRLFELGMGIKYDNFRIKQSENVFRKNFDMGALVYISYGQPINKNLCWEAGFATNNYKLNFRVKGPAGEVYSQRELVSVMRSNRLFLNIQHLTRELTPRISWVNSFGISLLIGAKNPYDVILHRGKEIETATGTDSIHVSIKTFGKTGSAILVGAGTRLYYQINKDFRLSLQAGFITGTGELTRVEVNYVIGSSPQYRKAIFSTNGFAPMLSFGVQYKWIKE